MHTQNPPFSKIFEKKNPSFSLFSEEKTAGRYFLNTDV